MLIGGGTVVLVQTVLGGHSALKGIICASVDCPRGRSTLVKVVRGTLSGSGTADTVTKETALIRKMTSFGPIAHH